MNTQQKIQMVIVWIAKSEANLDLQENRGTDYGKNEDDDNDNSNHDVGEDSNGELDCSNTDLDDIDAASINLVILEALIKHFLERLLFICEYVIAYLAWDQ